MRHISIQCPNFGPSFHLDCPFSSVVLDLSSAASLYLSMVSAVRFMISATNVSRNMKKIPNLHMQKYATLVKCKKQADIGLLALYTIGESGLHVLIHPCQVRLSNCKCEAVYLQSHTFSLQYWQHIVSREPASNFRRRLVSLALKSLLLWSILGSVPDRLVFVTLFHESSKISLLSR